MLVVDVSRHGARLRGCSTSAIGDRVTLEVVTGERSFLVPARVVWNDRARRRNTGIEFLIESESEAYMLDGLLAAMHGKHPSRGDVLVMVNDAEASRLAEAVRAAGFAPIVRRSATELAKHLCREPSTDVVAAIVSADLPVGARQEALAYLAEQWPNARRIVLPSEDTVDLATALRGAGRYG